MVSIPVAKIALLPCCLPGDCGLKMIREQDIIDLNVSFYEEIIALFDSDPYCCQIPLLWLSLLAIIHGLAWCKARDLPRMPIYTDSKIAMGWVAKKKCKTTLKPGPKTDDLLALIRRGEEWLKENPYDNPILKWETKRWGEIPADFGRK